MEYGRIDAEKYDRRALISANLYYSTVDPVSTNSLNAKFWLA
jgi:hypothetical protein